MDFTEGTQITKKQLCTGNQMTLLEGKHLTNDFISLLHFNDVLD